MADQLTRRETLKRGLVAAGVLALVPEWALPALAQGEADVPFTDIPATFSPTNPTGANRFLDIRKIDGLITPNDQFFFIQHYNKPEIDGAAYRLKLTGLVDQPIELPLADLKAMKSVAGSGTISGCPPPSPVPNRPPVPRPNSDWLTCRPMPSG